MLATMVDKATSYGFLIVFFRRTNPVQMFIVYQFLCIYTQIQSRALPAMATIVCGYCYELYYSKTNYYMDTNERPRIITIIHY